MQVAAKCSHTCPYKIETKGGLTPTHRGRCDHRSRQGSDTPLSQESCSHPTLEARKRCSFRTPWAWGGAALLTPGLQPNHIIPDLWLPELWDDDFLLCYVLWSITTNKASGADGIPVELFQILKDDAVKVLHSVCQQIWKTQQWPQDWKRSVFIPIPKKGNAKECSNYHTISLI